jgi:hypothetical protein
MVPPSRQESTIRPVIDPDFLKVFLPFEIQLAQRRVLTWAQNRADALTPVPALGLYLIRIVPRSSSPFPEAHLGGDEIGAAIHKTIQVEIRESDIPIRINNQEHLIIGRDVDPQFSNVLAQRVLTTISKSEMVQKTNLAVRVGYVVYPLSHQPNFPPSRWEELIDLARELCNRELPGAPSLGFGLLRGELVADTALPEADLIPLAFEDPDALAAAGVLRLHRIHVLPAV